MQDQSFTEIAGCGTKTMGAELVHNPKFIAVINGPAHSWPSREASFKGKGIEVETNEKKGKKAIC